MKIRTVILLAAALLAGQFSQAQITIKKAQDALGGLKQGGKVGQDEIGRGLKEALNNGVGEAVSFLSAKDGYFKSPYKILLPEEAVVVANKLKVVPGFNNLRDDLTERMNRAAEDAAVKAKPIFVSAITKMTFQDAMNILMGEKNAATQYLQKTTSDQLYAEFKPVIQESLDKVNARTLWHDAVSSYNRLPLVTKTNPDLDDHVTKMALKGLYQLVEKKELGIRADVNQRTSPLLQKVFAQQDK